MPSIKVKPTSYGSNQLTDKERLFVEEYLADNRMNAAAAARAAGYSGSSAAGKILAKPHVVRAIGKRIQERMRAAQLTADRVLEELMDIAFFDPLELFDGDGCLLPITEMSSTARRALAQFEVTTKTFEGPDGTKVTRTTAKIRAHGKIEALSLLAKHLGIMNDKIKLEHGVGSGVLTELLHRVNGANGNGKVIDSGFIEQAASET